MWPYPWTHVGTPSHLGHMDRVAATMPSKAHAGAAQVAPDIGQWEGQDVPLVRPSSCIVKGGIPSSRRYLPTSIPLYCSHRMKCSYVSCPRPQWHLMYSSGRSMPLCLYHLMIVSRTGTCPVIACSLLVCSFLGSGSGRSTLG